MVWCPTPLRKPLNQGCRFPAPPHTLSFPRPSWQRAQGPRRGLQSSRASGMRIPKGGELAIAYHSPFRPRHCVQAGASWGLVVALEVRVLTALCVPLPTPRVPEGRAAVTASFLKLPRLPRVLLCVLCMELHPHVLSASLHRVSPSAGCAQNPGKPGGRWPTLISQTTPCCPA